MDPDANLKEQRELAQAILTSGHTYRGATESAIRLAELVQALDEWIGRGGFLPAAWSGGGIRLHGDHVSLLVAHIATLPVCPLCPRLSYSKHQAGCPIAEWERG